MMGASIETTLELWASSLREVKSRVVGTAEGSQRRSNDLTGGVCRPALELKDHDCMTGATSNWPI